MEANEIDPTSPTRPTDEQIQAYLDSLKRELEESLRQTPDLEAMFLAPFGKLNGKAANGADPLRDDEYDLEVDEVAGAPELRDGILFASNWKVQHPVNHAGKNWVVHTNDLVDLWRGQVGANVIILIRPKDNSPG